MISQLQSRKSPGIDIPAEMINISGEAVITLLMRFVLKRMHMTVYDVSSQMQHFFDDCVIYRKIKSIIDEFLQILNQIRYWGCVNK